MEVDMPPIEDLVRAILGNWARDVDDPQAHVEELARIAAETVVAALADA
jgi:hypothetical protein